jgi:hypothetical protein
MNTLNMHLLSVDAHSIVHSLIKACANVPPIFFQDDVVLIESEVINEYLEERFPSPRLMPASLILRAQV